MTYIGLLAGLALLIWLALKGINVVFASLICALVVIVTNHPPLGRSTLSALRLRTIGRVYVCGEVFPTVRHRSCLRRG